VSRNTQIRELLERLGRLESEHRLLASVAQSSKSRKASIEVSLRSLTALSLKQDDLLKEAVEAAGFALYRSAHVAGFAALTDALHTRLDRLALLPAVAAKRPTWKVVSVEDLQDYADFQVSEVAREVVGISKSQMKTFQGLLHLRNQCAHPTGYAPDLDMTLGYLTSVIRQIDEFGR